MHALRLAGHRTGGGSGEYDPLRLQLVLRGLLDLGVEVVPDQLRSRGTALPPVLRRESARERPGVDRVVRRARSLPESLRVSLSQSGQTLLLEEHRRRGEALHHPLFAREQLLRQQLLDELVRLLERGGVAARRVGERDVAHEADSEVRIVEDLRPPLKPLRLAAGVRDVQTARFDHPADQRRRDPLDVLLDGGDPLPGAAVHGAALHRQRGQEPPRHENAVVDHHLLLHRGDQVLLRHGLVVAAGGAHELAPKAPKKLLGEHLFLVPILVDTPIPVDDAGVREDGDALASHAARRLHALPNGLDENRVSSLRRRALRRLGIRLEGVERDLDDVDVNAALGSERAHVDAAIGVILEVEEPIGQEHRRGRFERVRAAEGAVGQLAVVVKLRESAELVANAGLTEPPDDVQRVIRDPRDPLLDRAEDSERLERVDLRGGGHLLIPGDASQDVSVSGRKHRTRDAEGFFPVTTTSVVVRTRARDARRRIPQKRATTNKNLTRGI